MRGTNKTKPYPSYCSNTSYDNNSVNLIRAIQSVAYSSRGLKRSNSEALQVPTLQEVKEAVFNFDKNSVAGPDGFSSLLYQHGWEIIAANFLEVAQDLFDGASLPQGITSTTSFLCQKKKDAKQWFDFRPISLCTVLNKIITKLLANRLSKILLALFLKTRVDLLMVGLLVTNIIGPRVNRQTGLQNKRSLLATSHQKGGYDKDIEKLRMVVSDVIADEIVKVPFDRSRDDTAY
ncbi:Uncharacterized protein TCM_018750 [Theobroma cacao]|uniref:Reverse transcriptase domain-containing protein n=1 Tax=Theobroma cacao TaxID=3641 RepID=A0A061EGC3_THECC|nr:Uncharacterized protein TCM_018750 [Theobroma cacao]